MEKRSIGPGTLLGPLPVVLVGSYGEVQRDGTTTVIQNPMTAAWTGIVNSTPAMVSVSIRPERLSHRFIMETGEFTLNIASSSQAADVDFCGVKSGRDLDKAKACHLTPLKLSTLSVTAGYAECPVILACRIHEVKKLGSHDMFIGKIVDVLADNELFVKDRLDLTKADLLTYYHGDYYGQSRRIGFFGYSVAKTNVLKRRLPKEFWPKIR